MIIAELIGAEAVTANLEAMPARAQEMLRMAVSSLARDLLRKVKEEKLNGQVLKNRSTTLQRSINMKVDASPQEVVGSVGTNVRYAAAHEFGFQGTVSVPAHLRMMKQAFGKAVKNPRQIMVGAHAMKMNLPERSFLRSAMAEMETEIKEGLEAAVQKAIKEKP